MKERPAAGGRRSPKISRTRSTSPRASQRAASVAVDGRGTGSTSVVVAGNKISKIKKGKRRRKQASNTCVSLLLGSTNENDGDDGRHLDEDQIGIRLFRELTDYKARANHEMDQEDFYYRYYLDASDCDEKDDTSRGRDEEGLGSGPKETAAARNDNAPRRNKTQVQNIRTLILNRGKQSGASCTDASQNVHKYGQIPRDQGKHGVAKTTAGDLAHSKSTDAPDTDGAPTASSRKKKNQRFTRRMARDLDEERALAGLSALVGAMFELEEEMEANAKLASKRKKGVHDIDLMRIKKKSKKRSSKGSDTVLGLESSPLPDQSAEKLFPQNGKFGLDDPVEIPRKRHRKDAGKDEKRLLTKDKVELSAEVKSDQIVSPIPKKRRRKRQEKSSGPSEDYRHSIHPGKDEDFDESGENKGDAFLHSQDVLLGRDHPSNLLEQTKERQRHLVALVSSQKWDKRKKNVLKKRAKGSTKKITSLLDEKSLPLAEDEMRVVRVVRLFVNGTYIKLPFNNLGTAKVKGDCDVGNMSSVVLSSDVSAPGEMGKSSTRLLKEKEKKVEAVPSAFDKFHEDEVSKGPKKSEKKAKKKLDKKSDKKNEKKGKKTEKKSEKKLEANSDKLKRKGDKNSDRGGNKRDEIEGTRAETRMDRPEMNTELKLEKKADKKSETVRVEKAAKKEKKLGKKTEKKLEKKAKQAQAPPLSDTTLLKTKLVDSEAPLKRVKSKKQAKLAKPPKPLKKVEEIGADSVARDNNKQTDDSSQETKAQLGEITVRGVEQDTSPLNAPQIDCPRSNISLGLLDWRRRQQFWVSPPTNRQILPCLPNQMDAVSEDYVKPPATTPPTNGVPLPAGVIVNDGVQMWEAINPSREVNQTYLCPEPLRKRRNDLIYARCCRQLINFLDSRGRGMAHHEFFYSDIDRAWFNFKTYRVDLAQLGVPSEMMLTRCEWRAVRRRIRGRPKRFSTRFISSELDKLWKYRHRVREMQNSKYGASDVEEKKRQARETPVSGSRDTSSVHLEGFGYDVPKPIKVGAVVTAYNKRARMLQRGVVLTHERSQNAYLIQFDRKEFGCELCPDFEVASHGVPDILFPSSEAAVDGTSLGGYADANALPGSLPYGTTYGPISGKKRNAAKRASKPLNVAENVEQESPPSLCLPSLGTPQDTIDHPSMIEQLAEREALIKLMGILFALMERKKLLLMTADEMHAVWECKGKSLRDTNRCDPRRQLFESHYSWLHANIASTNRALEAALVHMQVMYGRCYAFSLSSFQGPNRNEKTLLSDSQHKGAFEVAAGDEGANATAVMERDSLEAAKLVQSVVRATLGKSATTSEARTKRVRRLTSAADLLLTTAKCVESVNAVVVDGDERVGESSALVDKREDKARWKPALRELSDKGKEDRASAYSPEHLNYFRRASEQAMSRLAPEDLKLNESSSANHRLNKAMSNQEEDPEDSRSLKDAVSMREAAYEELKSALSMLHAEVGAAAAAP